ncbi:MAG: ribosome biogenesis GTPase YlqF [Lachnospiraceae bacterium]|nr:ribosome biogenesis GTPase YlqF [Lachnospiraceae bacterium]
MNAYHWYPGHMAKAIRAMEEDIKLVDIIIELLDARAPLATRNPDIDRLGQGKGRIVLLNKADLASEDANTQWVRYFEDKGVQALRFVSKGGEGMRKVKDLLGEAARAKAEKDKKKGIRMPRPVRALVAGIPNVGKSTFINAVARKNVAQTGNRPGVTKGKQWITVSKGIELMDTPGVLWPKIDDRQAQLYLALIGSMKDEAINTDALAQELVALLKERYPWVVKERYGIEPEDGMEEALIKAARTLNALKKGGEPDTDRAEAQILDSFRAGRLGRITLEFP